MKRTLFSILIFIFAQSASAETVIGNGTPRPTTSSPQGSSINNTAKKSSSSAGTMQMVDIAAAAGFTAMCIGVPPLQKPPWCAMAAATAAMAGMMGGGKGNANAIDQATQYSGPSGNTPDVPNGDKGTGYDAGGGGKFTDPALAAIQSKLKDQGYVVSADGTKMTLPDGSTASIADMASGKVPGFQLNEAQQAQANKIMEDAIKQSGAHISAVGTSDGGGSLQPLAPTDQEASSHFDMSKYLKGLRKRGPASVSGLSKKLGGDNIGIQSDNIFEMVTRQYKRKQLQNSFLN